VNTRPPVALGEAGEPATTSGAVKGPTILRQGPSTQAQLPRRALADGFSRSPVAETIVLSDSTTVERSQLLHFSIQEGVADPLGERHRRFVQAPSGYQTGPVLVSRLPGGLVHTSNFVISTDEQRYLLDSFRHPQGLTRWGYAHVEDDIYEREVEEIEERPERVVVLGAQANANYSHWLIESVARALLFAPCDDGSALYLTPPLQSWQHQALALAGVPDERILTVPRRKLMRFPELFAVSRGMVGIPTLIPDAVRALARLAEPTARSARSCAGSLPHRPRLFVSRALVERRHISNEAELLAVLERHGFEKVHPETLSVSEQIELFARAEVVIGAFGTGLTNLIFSPPGTLVLELQPEGVGPGGNLFLWNLASIRDQRFAQVVCPITEGIRHLPLGKRDMTVDVRHIDDVLGELLALSGG
jgi:capsular polysaccharide biosynthesis protein